MEKKYIQFNKSMCESKRDENFAYVRHNLLDTSSRGMYPSIDFQEVSGVPAGAVVKKFVGGRVFVQDGNDVKIYNWYGDISLGSADYTISNKEFEDAVDGNDGVHWIDDDGHVWKRDNDITGGASVPHIGTNRITFDGTYYFFTAGNEIWRQLGDDTPTKVFDETGGYVKQIFAHSNNIFYITHNSLDFTINIWSKDSSTLLERKVIVSNARLLGIGSLDGDVIVVTGVGNSTNTNEKKGEIIVSIFDGEKLVRLNSIRAGDDQISVRKNAFAIGNGVMAVGIRSNASDRNFTLYKDWLLKIKSNGSIEAIHSFDNDSNDKFRSVGISYNFIAFGTDNGKFYYNNDDVNNNYGHQLSTYTNARYITNLLDFTGSKHKFGGIGISFEKIFNQQSELIISYRVSERDDWTVIDTVTAQKIKDNMDTRQSQTTKDAEYNDDDVGLNIQHYELTKMPDGTPFNEYYEIQFKFESKHGFSLIDAWYYTDYIKRETRK